MSTFHLYLHGRNGEVIGRLEFAAEDDAAAMMLADLLGDACSDRCFGYELWRGMHQVCVQAGRARPSVDIDQLTAAMLAVLLQCAEALQRGRFAVSGSRKLPKQLLRLRAAERDRRS